MTRATIPDSRPPTLPRPIARALRKVDVRLRVFASARRLGLVALVASVGAALGMAADFLMTLPPAIRWGIWGSWVAGVGLALMAGVVRPWLRRPRPVDLAAVAERADPTLGEHLTGAVALLDPRSRPDGSPALIAALAEDAASRVGAFDPSTVGGGGRALRRLILGGLAVVLVAAPSMIRPDPFRTLALRFLAPWRDLERVGWFVVTVRPGDATLAIGSDLEVEAFVAPRFGSRPAPEAAWLEWVDGGGKPRRSRMTARDLGPSSARGFQARLPRVPGSLTYRVATEATRSRAYRVTAVEPPSIAAIVARVEPPAYTKLPAGPARDPARIEAVEGSVLHLEVEASEPVEAIELAWPATPGPIALKAVGKVAATTLLAEAGGPYVLTPRRDRRGLDGRPEVRQLVVRPDRAPSLAVRGPDASGEARPDDVLPVGVAARDDFSVASAELHYEVRRSKSDAEPTAGRVDLKLDGLGSPLARGVGSLRLGDLALEPGDALAYRVKVVDNRPAPRGPNVTWSEPRALAIVASAEPLQAREDRARREEFGARLQEIREASRVNRRETEQLRYAADAAQRDGSAWDADRDRALEAREAEARAVVDRLQLLARDFEADPSYEALGRPARQAAEVEAEAGRAQLEKARKAAGPDRRLADLRQADARLGALGTRLDELKRRFDALAKLDLDRQKLRDLAGREDALARKAEDAADPSRVAAEQEDLRKALDTLLSQSPGLRAGILAAQSGEASKLAQSARALAERQRVEARQTAEGPRAEGLLRELARVQRALEDDARRLALEVDEPLAENGRARLDVEAIRRGVEPIEAGHLPEALGKLDEAEDALRRLRRDIEDVPADSRALARRLARRQELLANDVTLAATEARRQEPPSPVEQAAPVGRFKPLGDRQREVARLLAGIAPPEPLKGLARDAVQAVDRASDDLRSLRLREVEAGQGAAKKALNLLADSLPDPDRRRDEARRKLDEARRQAEEVARELAATDLPEKVAPLLPKAREAALALAAVEVEDRLRPQRDRAVARVNRMADAMQAVIGLPKPGNLREALAASRVEAQAALARLEQKSQGKMPADDIAEALAAEQRLAADRLAEERGKPPEDNPRPREEAADDRARIASALRNLPVAAEAPALLAEASRLAELAAPLEATPEAARAAAGAAEALARRLAEAQPGPVTPAPRPEPATPGDPELGLGPEQAGKAADLDRRQRHVRERLQAAMADRVTPQRDLRRDAQALGRDLADLRDRAREINARSRERAGSAADLAGQRAPGAMEEGAEQLARGRPDRARDAQRQAADLLEQAAREAEDLAAGLRAEAASEAGDSPLDAAQQLGPAREALREAARKLARGQGREEASSSMRQAAESIRAAARPPGDGPPAPPVAETSPDNPDPTSAPAGSARPDLAALQDLVRRKTGRKWGELPGHLRTEILQLSQGRYRDDYARLIQLYFREIAADAARDAKP